MARHGIPINFGEAGAFFAPGDGAGKPCLPDILISLLARFAPPQATTTALGLLDTDNRSDSQLALVTFDDSLWVYDELSTAVAGVNVVVPNPAPTAGRWLRLVSGTGTSTVLGSPAATTAALTAIASANRGDGEFVGVTSDNSLWQFSAASSAAAVTGLVLVPDVGTGRWFRVDAADVAITANIATTTALKGIAAAVRYEGQLALVQADGSLWRFVSASTSADTTESLVLVPTAGSGRWHRVDKHVDLKLVLDRTAADGATLFTVPVGFRLRPTVPFWEISTLFTTANAGVAGLSTSNAAGSTKGDLLGGAGLDAAASLTAGLIGGTAGTKIATVTPGLVLVAGDTIRWDKTNAFTAGAGFAHVPVNLEAL